MGKYEREYYLANREKIKLQTCNAYKENRTNILVKKHLKKYPELLNKSDLDVYIIKLREKIERRNKCILIQYKPIVLDMN